MKTAYKIGQKVKITSSRENLGENDALENYLGDVVTIKSVDEDSVYTVEEIEGLELSDSDIECLICDSSINLTDWEEDTKCPCCGSDDFTSTEYFETNGIFRDWTCNECNSKWTERYNLSKITCLNEEKEIFSELEEKLLIENEELKKQIIALAPKEYKYFWVDPESREDNKNHSSDLCEIIKWPEDSFEFYGYHFLDYKDYDHAANEGKFGIEIAKFDLEGTVIESIEEMWFETRELIIKYLSTFKHIRNKEDRLLYKEDLRFYPSDAIFLIKTKNGLEAEVYQSELWQLSKPNKSMSYFCRFEEEYESIVMFAAPELKDGSMSITSADQYYLEEEQLLLPLATITNLYDFDTNKTNIDFSFKYESDEKQFGNIELFFVNSNGIIEALIHLEDKSVVKIPWFIIESSVEFYY